VAGVYRELFGRWPAARDLARASEPEIKRVIHPLGLTGRAATLKRLAKEVETRGEVPTSLEQLTAFPGVGRYAAAATRAVAFGKREPTVDGVTARVYRRFFGLLHHLPPSTDRQLWELVTTVTPRSRPREWNWAVLDLAAEICLPKRPRCPACPLSDACAWAQQHVRVSAGL
jgi:A/G-specific adenine glycosylase